jgi:cation-transporting ATPase E
MFTQWPYPMVPLHLSVISALTIGVPSFFLAMEPNYERFSGHFLRGVLRRAFPGGLTNIFVVLAAQGFMPMFAFDAGHLQTVCTAILAVVGLLVLFQVSRPLNKFRLLIWLLMAGALVCCFTLLRSVFPVQSGNRYTTLVFLTLLMIIPTVFYTVQRIFHLGDKIYQRILRKRSEAHADL